MLSNVIANLITNALKYSEPGGRAEVRTRIADGRLFITIKDNGIGIPAEDQAHLFDRFFRGANVSHIQGTGLGLNIVKRYLDLMRGTIEFTSAPGNTVFSVQLPQHLPAINEPSPR
jgi:signal transduction histidine kinase